MLASALLYQASKTGGTSRILASPFPSHQDAHYPSLFLDQDLLSAKDVSDSDAREVLKSLLDSIPPTLIRALTVSALDNLSNTPQQSIQVALRESSACRVLFLLAQSDRPQLTIELVLNTILDRPDASSWHRQLLKKAFARSLSAKHAQELILSFASAVRAKLEKQASLPRTPSVTGGSATLPKPVIKVTTVKFLAQFLDDADFIPAHVAVDMLSQLFQSASHIDIRVTVVDSMLVRLAFCNDDSSTALAERLLLALQSTIPVLSSLNERRQTQEEDWIEAAKAGTLPEIYDDGGIDAYPPILDLVLKAVVHNRIPDYNRRKVIIQRILLPAIKQSELNSARWVKAFVSKHAPTSQTLDMLPLPVKRRMLVSLISSCFADVSSSVLDLYHLFVLTNMLPPPHLTLLNDKVNNDKDLRASDEGQHWLDLYGHRTRAFHSLGLKLGSTLSRTWQSSTLPDGIQVAYVQKLVTEQAGALLQHFDEHMDYHWNDFIGVLEPPAPYYGQRDKQAWLDNGRPIVELIISRIGALRTPAWNQGPSRQPKALPDTFRLRLWLLNYPDLNHSIPEGEGGKVFAEQLVSSLKGVMYVGIAYHHKLKDIESAALRCTDDDRVRCLPPWVNCVIRPDKSLGGLGGLAAGRIG